MKISMFLVALILGTIVSCVHGKSAVPLDQLETFKRLDDNDDDAAAAVSLCVYACMYMCVCVCACVYVCMCVCVYISCESVSVLVLSSFIKHSFPFVCARVFCFMLMWQ